MERLTKRITENQIELSAKANKPQHYSPIIHIEHPFWTAFDKLAEYEQAEEDGLLKILPVAIGSDVYFIPSKVNYDLNVLCNLKENNRVYHQKVERITFTDRGWYVECDKDCEYGTGRVLVDIFYKETWFTTETEAEAALAKMKGV